VFLSNRNLEPLYNVACTLRAFRLIQDRLPEARLVIAGDGSQRRQLEQLCGNLRLERVTFVGKLNSAEMASLYDRCDIYLNSPNIDNMPTSILEAFACGLPVVTTNPGGIPYIVENARNGLMVSVDDAEALAHAALRLIDDQLMATRLADAARAECEDRYVWSKVRAEWEECYLGLAN
jgi:glycosyltransferase involved in cell wall biosynthesis